MTPRVSVLITAYNIAPYIGATIRSALEQEPRDIEIIVVDDGSTDDTVAVIRGFGDSRIRLIQRSHEGPVKTLNTALSAARGEFAAFLDGDDVWHREKLVRHVQFLEAHPGVDLTFSWYSLIDEDGLETGVVSRQWRGTVSFEQLLADNVIGNGSLVVGRRSTFLQAGDFDEALGACHDLDMWLRVASLRARNIACVPGFLTYYRQRRGQLTRNVQLMESSWHQVMAKVGPIAPARVIAKAQSNMSRYFAYLLHEGGDYARANTYLSRSFRQAPGNFVSDRRSWKMVGANVAATLLPADWYWRLREAVLRPGKRKPGPFKPAPDPR